MQVYEIANGSILHKEPPRGPSRNTRFFSSASDCFRELGGCHVRFPRALSVAAWISNPYFIPWVVTMNPKFSIPQTASSNFETAFGSRLRCPLKSPHGAQNPVQRVSFYRLIGSTAGLFSRWRLKQVSRPLGDRSSAVRSTVFR